MKCYDWDQLLDPEDLLALTEEAIARRPARPLSWRRLGALAACLALILCLANYQALAAGVKRFAEYFSGVGAVDQDTPVLELEEPLTWTDGTWTCRLDAYQAGGQLFVEMEYLSTRLEPGADVNTGVPDYSYEMELLPPMDQDGPWLSQEEAVDKAAASYEDLNDWGSPEGAALREAGYRTYGSHTTLFQVGDFAGDSYRLRITFMDDSVMEGYQTVTYEKELNLIQAEAKAAISDSRTFPEGTVTVLVSADGSGVTNFVEWSETSEYDLPGHSLELQFIGASGKRYPAYFHNTYPVEFEHAEYYPRVEVNEPITAVEISQVSFWNRYGDRDTCYYNLNWVIQLPQE